MLNLVALCGKITKTYTGVDGDYYVTLEVENDYRETDGTLRTEQLPCTVWKGMLESLKEYYHPGQFVTIQGRIQNRDGRIVVMGEKIAFAQRYEKYRKKEKEE
ncbi:MAG: single-stranded DNA-binding protein [Bacilli bacterium]|nr:single-stranded DNA-binding protein [Bacilli bacterium]